MDETKRLLAATESPARLGAADTIQADGAWGDTVRVARGGTLDMAGAATLAADSAPSAITPSLAPTATSPRTTVLPRVEMVGAEARVVSAARLRYVEQAKLGEGGLGEVTGAVDQDIGRRVAVKRLRQEVKSDATLIRFAEEIRTIGKLEHPNIVPVHDVGVDERGDHFFVMKYVDGETLEAIIEKLAAGDPRYLERYTIERRVEIFMAVLEAVAFAHSRGIVHRDIKPANIMVGAYGEVVLMDWGIAKEKKAAEAQPLPLEGAATTMPSASASSPGRSAALETQVGQLVGTPFYMSPEQAKGQPVDERSDLYSLTMVFREMLALDHPLSHKRSITEVIDAVIHEPVPHIFFCLNPDGAGIPAELGHFVHRGLEKDPDERFQSAEEMLQRL
ncbi:MAG TPA: serine/threonine-protein kinase, partial [Polyangiaceae bacterium]|nr:serine/threonine-protein kinase [Polyangiaceae bacterium]